jgi:hypothetical protein
MDGMRKSPIEDAEVADLQWEVLQRGDPRASPGGSALFLPFESKEMTPRGNKAFH